MNQFLIIVKGNHIMPTAPEEAQKGLALFNEWVQKVLNGRFVTGGPATPFTQMTAEQQDAHLRAWQTSRLAVRRTGFQAMKRLCAAIYFGAPETFASAGYPGPPYELVKTALGAAK